MKTIGIISPSGHLSPEAKKKVEKTAHHLKSLGYEVIFGDYAFTENRYMSATDEQRASDVMKMYKNPNVIAILATRGGFGGCSKILDLLNFKTIKKNYKPFIGSSDITSLQNAIYTQIKKESYSGFMASYNDLETASNTVFSFENLINNKSYVINSGKNIVNAESKGVLIGGNLAIFRNMFGTKYCPDLKNKILFLEDEDEETHNIEMMLTQLKQQKNFNKIKGFVFGNFKNCHPQHKNEHTIEEVIEEFSKGLKIPVIKDFEVGHINNSYILPIGRKVKLISSNKICQIII